MVLALCSFLRIAAGDKLLFWDTSQAGENLANHLVDDLIQNVHSVAGLPGAIRLLAEFSVAGVANAERIVQSTIGELTPFPAGRQGEPCTTVAAVNVIGKQCLSTGTKRNMVFGFFRCVGRAIFPDTLCSFKLLLRDDLEFGHQFGAGISAAENAHVGQVADHSSQAARMPALSRAGTVSSIVQIGGNPLCAVTLVYIFIEDQPNDFGFLLVDILTCIFFLLLPQQALMLPQYLVLMNIGWLDSLKGLLIMTAFQPWMILLFWFAAKRIDSSLFDAAICDGANNWVLFRKIYVPIIRPYVAVAAFLSIAESWNLLEQPMTFLQSKEKYPLSMILMQLSTDNAELKNALCLLFVIPLIILFFRVVDNVTNRFHQ